MDHFLSETTPLNLAKFVVKTESLFFTINCVHTFTSAAWSSGKSTGLMISMVLVQNPLVPFCCVLGKDILRHFPLLGGLDKQF